MSIFIAVVSLLLTPYTHAVEICPGVGEIKDVLGKLAIWHKCVDKKQRVEIESLESPGFITVKAVSGRNGKVMTDDQVRSSGKSKDAIKFCFHTAGGEDYVCHSLNPFRKDAEWQTRCESGTVSFFKKGEVVTYGPKAEKISIKIDKKVFLASGKKTIPNLEIECTGLELMNRSGVDAAVIP